MFNQHRTQELLLEIKKQLEHDGVIQSRATLDRLMLQSELGRRGAGKPFPVSLGTFFLDPKEYQRAQEDVKLITSAAIKIRKAFAKNEPRIIAAVTLTSEEKDLLQYEKPDLQKFGVIRFDFFPTKDGWKLTELNSDNPDIIMICDEAVRMYTENLLPTSVRHQIISPPSNTDLLDKMLISVRGGTYHSVGIIGPLDRWIIGENNKSVSALASRGYNAVTGNLEDIVFDGKDVTLNGAKIDVLRRVAELHYFLERKERIQPLLDALRSNKIRMANALWDRILGHKSLFAIFTNPEFSDMFSSTEREVIQRCIPLTRLMTTDLFAYAIRERQNLVLKPSGESEAKGIFIGDETDSKIWCDAVNVACIEAGNWIIQERIWAKPIPVLIDHDAHLEIKDAIADISLHAFNIENGIQFGLLFSRYAFTAINNVVSGGGLIFPFVLKDLYD